MNTVSKAILSAALIGLLSACGDDEDRMNRVGEQESAAPTTTTAPMGTASSGAASAPNTGMGQESQQTPGGGQTSGQEIPSSAPVEFNNQ
jgi:uncharacterized lipoprotein